MTCDNRDLLETCQILRLFNCGCYNVRMKLLWNKKKCRMTVYVLLVAVGLGILIYSMREPEPVGAPEQGARGDVIQGETVPVFE
jgi:hypothetical protein